MSRERGSATVWATVVATALVAVFGGVLLLGQAVVARHRAGRPRIWRPWPRR